MIQYSIVIPTYNHCDDLLKPCVDSLLQHTCMTEVELIISANGCTDRTQEYLLSLQQEFARVGMADHFKYVWSQDPLGYAKACNRGIQTAGTDKIVLLNNDCVFLPQKRNFWLNALNQPFDQDPQTGISCVVKSWSDPAAHDFAIFFCVMIHKKVFDAIGVLNESYGKGGGEDTEFSIECERAGFKVVECLSKQWNHASHVFTGEFPIYHKGEGTVHDQNLVPDWPEVFAHNSRLLAQKYNPSWLNPTQTITCSTVQEVAQRFSWLKNHTPESPEIFSEVIENNCYSLTPSHVNDLVVIDVGANQGMFSILAAALGACEVISCEPMSHTQALLRSNLAKSGLDHKIKAIQAAVVAQPHAPIAMGIQTDSGKNSVYMPQSQSEWVNCVTLEQIVSDCAKKPIFLKMDCEGSEYDILLDTPNHVFDRIKHVAIEIHGDTHPVHKGIQICQNRLRDLGFEQKVHLPYGTWWYDSQGKPIKWEPMNMSVELWSRP